MILMVIVYRQLIDSISFILYGLTVFARTSKKKKEVCRIISFSFFCFFFCFSFLSFSQVKSTLRLSRQHVILSVMQPRLALWHSFWQLSSFALLLQYECVMVQMCTLVAFMLCCSASNLHEHWLPCFIYDWGLRRLSKL